MKAITVAISLAILAVSSPAIAQNATTPQTARQTPPRDTQPTRQTGTAVIRGRVVAADTSRPLRRAQIRLTAPELGRDNVTMSTDADGRYEITDLPAGRYTLQVSRSGYLPLRYGQRRPLEQGTPLQLLDRQVIDNVDFALPKSGLITGRITDELGDPMAGVLVSAMRSMYFGGRRQVAPETLARTDDDGEYRLIGLTPATYMVQAKAADKWTEGEGAREETFGYAPTYLPGTTSAGDARRITIGVGQEAGNADFAMIPGRAAKITGTATDSHGQPVKNVALIQETMGPGGGLVGISGNAVVAPDGTFTVRNVPPGEYKLQAAGSQEQIVQPIVVDGVDIANVALTTSTGWSVSGRVATENDASPTFPRARARISSRSLAGINGMSMQDGIRPSQIINDDWTFAVKGIAGLARLDVSLPDGWSLKAVRHDGRDIADTAMELKSGEELSGVQVVLSNRVTSVTGDLLDEKGAPLPDGTVIVFAADSSKWFDGSRFVQATRPDQKGRYQIKGLPAGDYLAIAVDFVEQGVWNDPEYLASIREHAQKITLDDGGAQVISLKLVMP